MKTQEIRSAHRYNKAYASQLDDIPLLSWWQKLLPISLLTMLTIVFYYPSLRYPFQFDDLANITKKFEIRSFDTINMFIQSRWLGEWLNRINYKIGLFDPFYYRSFNVAIHLLAGIVTFFFILAICSKTKKYLFLKQNALWIATITVGLFLLHPVQTQTVSYVIQGRLEGLASFLGVASLLAFFYAFTTTSIVKKIALIAMTFVFGFLSCGAKEIVIVLPFLALLVDWFFIAEGDFKKIQSKLLFHISYTIFILCVLIYYMHPEYVLQIIGLQLTTANNRGNILTTDPSQVITPIHYLISEFKVVLHYLTIFLWPFTMSAEYDWKLSENFLAPDSFFPFLALLAIVGVTIELVRRQKHEYVVFGLWWFFLTVAPRSSIIPSPELICDYKTYLASIGWLFVMAVGIVKAVSYGAEKMPAFAQQTNTPRHKYAAIMICCAMLGSGTLVRNYVWRSSIEFWQDVVNKAPTKARAYNNLGVALSEDGKFKEAIPLFLQAIKLDRVYSDPWSNVAVAYSVENQDEKAIVALKEAIRIFPSYPEAYNNLGTLILKKKDYALAENLFRTAIKIRPYYGKAFFNLGRLYLEKGEQEEAWNHFKKATEGDLDNADGFMVLGQISMQQKKYKEAIEAFMTIKQRGGGSEQLDFNLANAFFLSEKIDEARMIYQQLAAQYPQDPRYSYNHGEALFTLKQFAEAQKSFEQAAACGPSFAQAKIRVAHCLENLDKFDDAKACLESFMQVAANDDLKKTAELEISRLGVQRKIREGNGVFTAGELQAALGNRAVKIGPRDEKKS